jgi:NADH:ubiquinone oxidoreductase subunit E
MADFTVSEGPATRADATVSVKVCMGSSCFACGNKDALDLVMVHLEEAGLNSRVDLRGHLCADRCSRGPILTIGESVHEAVSPEGAIELILHACGEKP